MKSEFTVEHVKQIKNNLPYLKGILLENTVNKQEREYIKHIIDTLDKLLEDWFSSIDK